MKRRRSAFATNPATDPTSFLDPDRIAASNYSGGAFTRLGFGFQADALPVGSELYRPPERAGEERMRYGPTASLSQGNASSVLSDFGTRLVECLANGVIPAQNQGFYMQRQAVTELSILIQGFLRDGTQFFQDGRVEEEVVSILVLMSSIVSTVTNQNKNFQNRAKSMTPQIQRGMRATNAHLRKAYRREGNPTFRIGSFEDDAMLIARGGYTYDDVEHPNDVMQIERASRAMSGMSGVVGGVEETLNFAITNGKNLLRHIGDFTGEPFSETLKELLDRFQKVTLRLRSQS